ncbi:Rid family detoxifying hydrolase [Alkalibacterium pelagium]|uniref:2-iminobutanoate/2-iminopropanoate deaminase n=1 Tax=Alkalibacterium pelagium TaxID=426702 RepID=A0A1H7IPA4_9LACT|nr:Rid family detoxifying hydrolase [Alkalibacterium pelagium]GEN50148.1 endoribonuclease [Alkalibacterium pelagium]SEK63712.1 2-iminobutanoate/2-iminopropanoate deaminase [Alkalibacterium pelagium]
MTTSDKRILNSIQAPAAIGPYSQAVIFGNTVYVSGQLPIDAEAGKITAETAKEQTRQSLKNIEYILAEENLTLSDVLKVTVLLSDISNFQDMNEVYSEFFKEPFPARVAYEVAALPAGALVEIDVIAGKAD